MTGEQRLHQLIADLDNAARREIASAAEEGRFDELPSLVSIAKEIAALAMSRVSDHLNETIEVSMQCVSASPPVEGLVRATTPQQAISRTKRAKYPQFLREKHDLVKLGWSSRGKRTYEHRVPKASVDAVAAAVASRGKLGHRFTVEEVMKSLSDSKSNGGVPSYQVYAVVSWLKWAGMVIQHGRQGYTVVRPQTFTSSIETAWQSLAQR